VLAREERTRDRCFAYALARSRGETLLFRGDDLAQTDIEPTLKD
jgi:uncharacterized protein with PIN domain